jgi:circadian clock protein KaiC
MEQDGSVQLCWQPTTEGLLDQVGARLLERVEAQGSKRVLIDSLGAFSRLAIDPARSMRFSAPWPVSCARVM